MSVIAQTKEKTTHDLILQWTLWTTIPPLPKRKPLFSLPPKEQNSTPNFEEEEDIESIKSEQRPGKMRKIGDFSSFEDFWTIFDQAEKPSEIQARGGLFCFRKDVVASADDPVNRSGNRYSTYFDVDSKDEAKYREIEKKYLHILLTILGHNFQYSEKVTGVIFQSFPAKAEISVWVVSLDDVETAIFERNLFKTFGKDLKIEKKKIA